MNSKFWGGGGGGGGGGEAKFDIVEHVLSGHSKIDKSLNGK